MSALFGLLVVGLCFQSMRFERVSLPDKANIALDVTIRKYLIPEFLKLTNKTMSEYKRLQAECAKSLQDAQMICNICSTPKVQSQVPEDNNPAVDPNEATIPFTTTFSPTTSSIHPTTFIPFTTPTIPPTTPTIPSTTPTIPPTYHTIAPTTPKIPPTYPIIPSTDPNMDDIDQIDYDDGSLFNLTLGCVDSIEDLVGTMVSTADDVTEIAGDSVNSLLQSVLYTLWNALKLLLSTAACIVENALEAVMGIAIGITDFLEGLAWQLQSLTYSLLFITGSIAQNLLGLISNLANTLLSSIAGLVDSVGNLVTGLFGGLTSILGRKKRALMYKEYFQTLAAERRYKRSTYNNCPICDAINTNLHDEDQIRDSVCGNGTSAKFDDTEALLRKIAINYEYIVTNLNPVILKVEYNTSTFDRNEITFSRAELTYTLGLGMKMFVSTSPFYPLDLKMTAMNWAHEIFINEFQP